MEGKGKKIVKDVNREQNLCSLISKTDLIHLSTFSFLITLLKVQIQN